MNYWTTQRLFSKLQKKIMKWEKGRAHVCTKLEKRNNHEILVKGSIYLVIGPCENATVKSGVLILKQ